MRTSLLVFGLLLAACAAPPSLSDRSSGDDDDDTEETRGNGDESSPGPTSSETDGSPAPSGSSDPAPPTNPPPTPTGTTTTEPPPPPPPPPEPITSVTVTWQKISDQSFYSLDVQANGTWTAPCIGSPILKKNTSAVFNATCPSANNTPVSLESVQAFRLCWAHNDNWAVANCLTRPYKTGEATLNFQF